MTIHRVFSANLRERCIVRGTIADFCKHAGINRQQFNRYLSGAALPNPATMARISTCLGIREEELFSEKISKPSQADIQNKGGAESLILKETISPPEKGFFLFSTEHMKILLEAKHPMGVTDGYFYCYFPAQGLDNYVVRTLMRIRVSGSMAYFKRLTVFRNKKVPGMLLSVSKHVGCILSDANVSYFVGKESNSDTAISVLVFENNPKAGTKIQRGLGIVQGFSSHLACQLCLEKIPQEHSNRRKMLSTLGLISIDDSSLSPVVKGVYSNRGECPKSLITMPSIEQALL